MWTAGQQQHERQKTRDQHGSDKHSIYLPQFCNFLRSGSRTCGFPSLTYVRFAFATLLTAIAYRQELATSVTHVTIQRDKSRRLKLNKESRPESRSAFVVWYAQHPAWAALWNGAWPQICRLRAPFALRSLSHSRLSGSGQAPHNFEKRNAKHPRRQRPRSSSTRKAATTKLKATATTTSRRSTSVLGNR